MKIALVYNGKLPAYGYGGIERIVVSLIQEYQRRGHQVFLLCAEGSRVENCEVRYIPRDETKDASSLLPDDVEFIHFHEPIRERPKKPFLVTIHGNGQPGEHFFPNTNFVSRSHARNHHAKYFVYQGVEIDKYPFVQKKDDYFVFMALTKRWCKNVHTAIDWANELGVRLEIIGGCGRSTRNIRYHGILGDHEGRLELIANARALLYPTNWHEPCAIAPLEALACGTPVISSANGAMPETIRPSTGIICRTYEDMLSAYNRLNEIHPEACRSLAEKTFSSAEMAAQYLALYDQIIRTGELDQLPRYDFKPGTIEHLLKPSVRNALVSMFRTQKEKYRAKFWQMAAAGYGFADFASSLMVDL